MSDETERPVASAGSVAERPVGDPEIAVEILKLRVAELEQAIRRLAEQDATLSACGGNVTVTMDATLTVREVLENLATLGASYETVSRGGSPTGNYFFAINVADMAASLKAAQVLISQLPCWIPVDEQWPNHGSDVLVAYKAGKYVLLGVGEFDGTTANDEGITTPYFKGIGGFEVTHWMPLPEPPEVK